MASKLNPKSLMTVMTMTVMTTLTVFCLFPDVVDSRYGKSQSAQVLERPENQAKEGW